MKIWQKADGNTSYNIGDEIEYGTRRGIIARKDYGLCAGDSEQLFLASGERVLSEDVSRINHVRQ